MLRRPTARRLFAFIRPLAPLLLAACAGAPADAPPAAAPVSSSSPPPSPPAVAVAPAPPTSATEVLAQGRAPLDACYARARQARPDLRRTSVEITFTLDDSGKPVTVALEYRHRMDEAAKECMRTAALALQFPAPLRGKQTGTIEFTPPQ
jgi:hypothetical protein